MTFSELERRAIDEAVPAWIEASRCIAGHGAFRGETPDRVLQRHGIVFDADRTRFGAIETEVRYRAYRALGAEPPLVTETGMALTAALLLRRPSNVCPECWSAVGGRERDCPRCAPREVGG